MDLWDRLFKVNLPEDDAGIAIEGFAAALSRYAAGDVTLQQLSAFMRDAQGALLPPAQLADATLLTDLLDVAVGTLAKMAKAEQIRDVLTLAELGWIDKAQGKALLGV